MPPSRGLRRRQTARIVYARNSNPVTTFNGEKTSRVIMPANRISYKMACARDAQNRIRLIRIKGATN
ncbi:hypothetical protein ACOSP7_013422 [Xanthoceras sorbifolium]